MSEDLRFPERLYRWVAYDRGDQATYSGIAATDREMEKTRLFYTSGHPIVGRLKVVEYARTTLISWEDNDRSEAALNAWRKTNRPVKGE